MKRVEFASLLVMVVMVPRRPVCVETMRNIIMQIMIHRSEYLHLHSCVRAPFLRGPRFFSLSRSLSYTHALSSPPLLFSPPLPLFCLIQIRSPIAANREEGREGGRRKGKEGFSPGGLGIYIYYRVGPVQQQTWFKTRHKQVRTKDSCSFLLLLSGVRQVCLCVTVCNPVW